MLNCLFIVLDSNLKIGESEFPTLSVEPKENRVFINGELIGGSDIALEMYERSLTSLLWREN